MTLYNNIYEIIFGVSTKKILFQWMNDFILDRRYRKH